MKFIFNMCVTMATMTGNSIWLKQICLSNNPVNTSMHTVSPDPGRVSNTDRTDTHRPCTWHCDRPTCTSIRLTCHVSKLILVTRLVHVGMAVISSINGDLSNARVMDLLNFKDYDDLVSHLPPVKPKAGEIFLYSPLSEASSGQWYYVTIINILLCY